MSAANVLLNLVISVLSLIVLQGVGLLQPTAQAVTEHNIFIVIKSLIQPNKSHIKENGTISRRLTTYSCGGLPNQPTFYDFT